MASFLTPQTLGVAGMEVTVTYLVFLEDLIFSGAGSEGVSAGALA